MESDRTYFKWTGFIYLVVFILFAACSSYASSGDTEKKSEEAASMKDVKEKVMAAGESISSYSAEQRDQAVEKAKEELSDLDRKIDELSAKMNQQWDRLSADSKQKWQDSLAKLREKRVEAAEWYGGVKRGSAEAWEEVKKGYGKAYSELDQAWEKAKKEFTEESEGKGDTEK